MLTLYKNSLLSSAYAKYQNDIKVEKDEDGNEKLTEMLVPCDGKLSAVDASKCEPYNLKNAIRILLREYNSKRHSTTRMTPNEAYL